MSSAAPSEAKLALQSGHLIVAYSQHSSHQAILMRQLKGLQVSEPLSDVTESILRCVGFHIRISQSCEGTAASHASDTRDQEGIDCLLCRTRCQWPSCTLYQLLMEAGVLPATQTPGIKRAPRQLQGYSWGNLPRLLVSDRGQIDVRCICSLCDGISGRHSSHNCQGGNAWGASAACQ